MKKRILQIIPSLERSGTAKQLSLTARGLPRDEFDLHVCAIGRGGPIADELAAAGVPVTVINTRWPVDPLAYWRLHRHVARLKPELIHTWQPAATVYGHAVAKACGVERLVVGLRSLSAFDAQPTRYVTRHCWRVVVNSPVVRDAAVHRGLPAERILVVPNAVQPAAPSTTTRRQLLAELGLPEDARLIGAVGPLLRRKRLKDAIWIADLLKVIRDDVHLLIVGDGPHRDRLDRFREQVRIPDKVHFLGTRGDVPRLLPHLDVFWSTGTCDVSPNAVMEAMAAGVPVVAADVPGLRDLVVPESTGYLASVGNRATFTRYTQILLDDANLSQQFGQAGRQRMEELFTLDKMTASYADLYCRRR